MAHMIEANDNMMSVRQMPWHGLGVVLDDYPDGIDDALEKSGLTWAVKQGDVFVARPIAMDNPPADGVPVGALESYLVPAEGFQANIREDTGDVLGIVSKGYKVVPNRDAFAWLNDLLGSDLQFETAGSLQNGRRVWVLARRPDNVEVGGDPTATYVYCANSHDGSMAVTAAATSVRIVCANTLGWAMSKADATGRVYRFHHTGDMQHKLDEARRAMDVVLDWDAAFKKMGDELARQKMSIQRFDSRVVTPLLGLDTELTDLARKGREKRRDVLISIYKDETGTAGNSPRTKWCAANAIAEYADWNRLYVKNGSNRTDQVQRSFEDQTLKQTGLDLVIAA